MKQKTVIMATTFTMLLSVGVIGLGSETLHQHPAYTGQTVRAEVGQASLLSAPGSETLLLAASPQRENE